MNIPDNPVFKLGQMITCTGSRGYAFTTGKQYEVHRYEPVSHDYNYTWPAYVGVIDDNGVKVMCHARRFEVSHV